MTAPEGNDGTEDGSAETVASDMFFGLAAILIVVLSLMSQTLRHSIGQSRADSGALVAQATSSGRYIALAEAASVTLLRPDGPVETLPLDAILGGRVAAWAQGRPDLWVVITPAARDSAFLLDTALSRAKVAQVHRIRLDRPCPRPQFTAQGLTCDG